MKNEKSIIKELTELYSEKGYTGKYLMAAVFHAGIIVAGYVNDLKAAEYFLLRLKQTKREIENEK